MDCPSKQSQTSDGGAPSSTTSLENVSFSNHAISHMFAPMPAAPKANIGGWWSSYAYSTRLLRRHRPKHINWKEAYAILFALAKWGEAWRGCQITFMCDNSTVVSVINKESVHSDAIDPFQLIFHAAALYDIEINSCWSASEENWIADAFSRFTQDSTL